MNKNIVLMLVVVAVIVSGGYIFLNIKPSQQIIAEPVFDPSTADSIILTDANLSSTFVPTQPSPTTTLKEGEDMRTSSIKSSDLPKDIFSENFVWQTPEEISKQGIVVENFSPCGVDMGPGCNWFQESETKYYQFAKFSYKDKVGSVFYIPGYSWSFTEIIYYKNEYIFVNYDNKITLLTKISPDLTSEDGLNKTKFFVDKNTTLPKSLNIPKELKIPGKQKLYLINEPMDPVFKKDGNIEEKIANFDNKDIWNYGDFFLTFTNNLPTIQPVKYNIELPTSFTLQGGKKMNSSIYDSTRVTGCGGKGGVDVIKDLNEKDLKIIGKANDGNSIYKFSNTADGSEEAEMFKNYNGYKESTNQPTSTFENFLANNPIIIMKDGFGRFIRFTRQSYYVQMAECGKPVIYLYPTKETKINVQVKPNGGLTKVDPFYPADGWLVNAKPNGELTNTDGQNYPYLFWEGNAYDMKIPTEGFVLKKENIRRDMTKLLARLGLNEKETNDFLEFWQTKMEVKPYVFVTFISQTDFDKVAPLNISPRPDKTIRVFMEYQPLDFEFKAKPLKIETPARSGFTVVEWGGRLHQ